MKNVREVGFEATGKESFGGHHEILHVPLSSATGSHIECRIKSLNLASHLVQVGEDVLKPFQALWHILLELLGRFDHFPIAAASSRVYGV